MLDYHIHSAFSLDADSSMDDYCEAAIAKGAAELAFTDHLDIYYPHDDFSAIIDVEKYNSAVERVRSKYPKLTIRKGIEVGYHPEAIEESSRFISALNPDFVINSVHVVENCDPYYIKYFDKKTRETAYTDYIEALLNSLEAPYPYSVVGHIGYVAKRAPYPYPAILLNDYHQLMDTVLYKIIYSGHGLELNVSSIKNTKETMPAYSILQRYRELGGEIVTYGSDAHNAKDYLANWECARDMLMNAGFRYVCGFDRMIPTFNPL